MWGSEWSGGTYSSVTGSRPARSEHVCCVLRVSLSLLDERVRGVPDSYHILATLGPRLRRSVVIYDSLLAEVARLCKRAGSTFKMKTYRVSEVGGGCNWWRGGVVFSREQ